MEEHSAPSLELDLTFAKAKDGYERDQLVEAERYCQSILDVDAGHFDSTRLLGLIFLRQGKVADAERLISRAIELRPNDATLHFQHGKALQGLERFDEALLSYEGAIALEPDFAEAFNNRGNVLHSLRRFDQAVTSYDKSIALKPGRAHVFNNRGNALMAARRLREAYESYSKAVALSPDFSEPFFGRARVDFERKRYTDGLEDCKKALAIDPGDVRVTRMMFGAQLSACDWHGLESQKKSIGTAIETGANVVHPGDHRSFSDSEEQHLRVARNWIKAEAPPAADRLWSGELYRHSKIRLAYLSGDFREHATTYLIAGVFEQHDKSKFEITAVSSHPGDKSGVRERIVSASDRFIDIHSMTDIQVARCLRAMEIDILVDLNGLAGEGRTPILAMRPAPIQVNYLGYPGTMGASFMDYIIADHTVIPDTNRTYYSEKIAYLPDTYQPNDSQREVPVRPLNRSEAGLPEPGFVFCCLNHPRKISAQIFEVWMRLLGACPESVLWLLGDSQDSVSNLRRGAVARDIAPSRLVFAPHTSHDNHLARHRLADLFLDTHPYNAHTTASDALRTGLPVLTCMGNTFSGRVAASLLYAVGLPELVTNSIAEYEELALRLARDPMKLSEIKTRLIRNRETYPLFDTSRYTKNLEAAFIKMWRRHQNGKPPESFTVGEPE